MTAPSSPGTPSMEKRVLQAVLLSLVFIFVTLNSRDYAAVIPRRDYADYIAGETRLYP